ncbi:hypothetical protein BDY19DRAFT_968482 [Irpex rosettiformis]|uniref:Uncharacterized protein n=1 Tax=Irpex rosettiformis TaxID=378272 RepID=A0ACB8TSA1_9APHY|nr:hypothetical protein BDY19DRAFT_968482 [Irpex rosettiformis]
MLITRLCAWILMMTFPAYFTTTFIFKHRPQASLTSSPGEWLRASLCRPSPEYYEAQVQLVNLTHSSSFPHTNQNNTFDDLDDGLPYDSEWRRAVASKVYRGTSATNKKNTGSGYVLRKYQLVEPSTVTDLEKVQQLGDNDYITMFNGNRNPRQVDDSSLAMLVHELIQFILVIAAIIVVICLGALAASRFLPPDDTESSKTDSSAFGKVPETVEVNVEVNQQPIQNPMDTIPGGSLPDGNADNEVSRALLI